MFYYVYYCITCGWCSNTKHRLDDKKIEIVVGILAISTFSSNVKQTNKHKSEQSSETDEWEKEKENMECGM